MNRIFATILAAPLILAGCTTAQISQVSQYQQAVQNACTIASAAAADPLAAALVASNSDVASAVNLVKASCGTEEAVATLVLSPTSVAWVNTLTTTLKSGGKVVPPAPISTPS